jgi:hypothetical protein
MEKPKYTVIVGNVGMVYGGNNARTAMAAFNTYKSLSVDGIGRAAHEPVTILAPDGEIIKEHLPEDVK